MYKQVIIFVAAIHNVIYCDVMPLERYHRPSPVRDTLTNERIISGNYAVTGQFPWQVAIEARTTGILSSCGGSLISSNSVLTAAHCCKDFTTFKISLGSVYKNSPLVTRNVDISKVVIHPKYSTESLNYDAAIIKLDQDVPYGTTIQPIALPRFSDAVENSFFDLKITISGWGHTETDSAPPHLQYTDMYVIKNADCKLYFGNSIIIESTICALGTQYGINGPCFGDSGGPAIIYRNNSWMLIGITSFLSNTGCQATVPAGFMNVSFLLSWISANTGIPISNFM